MQLRTLCYAQLQDLFFAGRHPSVISRGMHRLADTGWIRLWEERVPVGGHPCYVLPTQRAMRWARRDLLQATERLPHAPLVQTMLRDRSPRPLPLKKDEIPNYLAHQRELNDVLIAFLRTPALQTLWASSWHRPFPIEYEQLMLPQPDGVIVRVVDGAPRLLFLEHDRGTEPPGDFQNVKAQRYGALARVPDTLETLTGFRTFSVLVTVHADRPLDRIRELQQASYAAYGASMLSFTVDEWLLDAPDAAVCFDALTMPTSDALDPRAHGGLQRLPV